MRLIAICLVAMIGVGPRAALAQDSETLADIRQQLSVLYVEIQSLKRELSTTGSPTGVNTSGTTLQRIDAIEAEVQRLTGRTERLEQRIDSVVQDGTNRIGDLEFRLVELEGGDVSDLGETTTLGGDVETSPAPTVPSLSDGSMETSTQLAVGERADFERASAALEGGDAQSAADQFEAFLETYPGSPLEAEAYLRRGQALEAMERLTPAARAYLDSYSQYPQSDVADEALYNLGRALGLLDKVSEACVTLGEVETRHPGSAMIGPAQAEMQSLGCN
ncbi:MULTISPECIES: tetratricopeptide repeat protein [Shimia]|uniref:tetratricopeptide repeat protein n=1 Tax=Shimia TaxID=573139 RepID=UPI001FB3CD9F|nr:MULTISPECIES: tetratricopeptide repeat protein [Shimia]MDV4145759.1 tetratricopeptide repeat protein [Shimia sp. FJ5]